MKVCSLDIVDDVGYRNGAQREKEGKEKGENFPAW